MKKTIIEFDPKRITQCLIQKGLSKNKASVITGIKRQQFRQYEKGDCCPSVDTLTMICNGLDVPVEYFFVKKQVCVPD